MSSSLQKYSEGRSDSMLSHRVFPLLPSKANRPCGMSFELISDVVEIENAWVIERGYSTPRNNKPSIRRKTGGTRREGSISDRRRHERSRGYAGGAVQGFTKTSMERFRTLCYLTKKCFGSVSVTSNLVILLCHPDLRSCLWDFAPHWHSPGGQKQRLGHV